MSAGWTRRDFIRVTLLATGALVVEACASSVVTTTTSSTTTTTAGTTTTTTEPGSPDDVFAPEVSVRIDGTGAVVVTGHRSEMGQGILTAMAMIVAEELDAAWDDVSVEQADAGARYGDQTTGGSTSVASSYRMLRTVGARARAILVAAAAARWDVAADSCTTAAGEVTHPPTGRSARYGELVVEAAALDPGSIPEPVLKDPAEFGIIGTDHPLAHGPAAVTGEQVYASDVQIDGMRTVALVFPPTLGADLAGFDPGPCLQVPGVEQVLEVDAGVAVVATSTWAALRGRDALEATWAGGQTDLNSDDVLAGFTESSTGDPVYDHPFFAHAPMEPTVVVVDPGPASCEVWAPVQRPIEARDEVAVRMGLPLDAVTLHVSLAGGRFGRGLRVGYVAEAADVAARVGGPVRVMWTREDETRRDRFHPLAAVTVTATEEFPLETAALQTRRANRVGVPVGPWRAVVHFTEAFALESFRDEAAHALGLDPVEARMRILPRRARTVLETAAAAADWGSVLPAGRGRGVASYSTWGVTETAAVAEVTVDGGVITVDRVVCAVDCGTVVNPDTVRAQVEGGIVWGLSAALKGGVDIVEGRVIQGNFDDYPILRFDEMPRIEVHLVPSDESPSGIGEMAVPLAAPAVANAVFAATGRRLRRLPLRLDG